MNTFQKITLVALSALTFTACMKWESEGYVNLATPVDGAVYQQGDSIIFQGGFEGDFVEKNEGIIRLVDQENGYQYQEWEFENDFRIGMRNTFSQTRRLEARVFLKMGETDEKLVQIIHLECK
ncbi:MAG: hypothetical protein EP338_07325 [Bacteroidetes bacterium]|nr:MAG: hypothetical protein EP338_07325 [Bacteroidota bacterium]